jgi:glycosyltransferase involved in cell wall biosynthesis
MNDLTVAVLMITYNHENFIEQAVESVMSQITNFKYKLFIGEDCSSDGTRKKCIALKEKYPDQIELTLNNTNLGAAKNAHQISKICFNSKAKYIAVIEGDDYWTDVNKLQFQIDFLDRNLDFIATCHNVQQKSEGKIVLRYPNSEDKVFYEIDFLERLPWVITVSLVHRNPFFFDEKFIKIFDFFYENINSPAGDWPYNYLLSKYGKYFYFDKSMAVYREHGGGVWSGNKDIKATQTSWNYRILNLIYRVETNIQYKKVIKSRIDTYYRHLFLGALKKRELFKACYFLFKTIFSTSLQYKKNMLERFVKKYLLFAKA